MKTTTKYNLGKLSLIPVLGGMLFAACEKDPVEKPQPSEPKVTTVTFNTNSYTEDIKKAKIDSLCAIYDTIYTTPEAGWGICNTQQIALTTQYLEWYHNKYDKLSGRGSFDFTPGVASVEDSLKLISYGYKINGR